MLYKKYDNKCKHDDDDYNTKIIIIIIIIVTFIGVILNQNKIQNSKMTTTIIHY